MQPPEARLRDAGAGAAADPSLLSTGTPAASPAGDELLLEGLRPATLGLALVFLAFLVSGLLGFPHPPAVADVVSDAVAVLTFLVLWTLLSRRRIPPRWAHPVGALAVAVALTNILLAFALFGDRTSTLYVALLLIGVAAIGVSRPWVTGAMAAVLGSWAIVASQVLPRGELAAQAIALGGATLASGIMVQARQRVQRLIGRLLEDRNRQQRQVEELLEQSQTRYRQIVELALEGIAIIDPDGAITYSNARFGELLGRHPQELLGRSLVTFVAPEDREQVVRRWATRATGSREVYEVRYLHADGERIHCMVSASPLFDEQGRHLGNLGLVSDITSRVRAEEGLQRSERDYRQLFEGAHDAILVIDPETEVVLEANQRACEAYGRPYREMIGTCLKGISVDPERGREQVRTTVSLPDGAVHRFETAQLRSDGSTMHLDVSASLVEFRGEPAILSINRDVTEQRGTAEALRTSHARLEILGSIWQGIARLDPPQKTAQRAVRGLLELVPCVHGAVILIEPHARRGRVLCFEVASDGGADAAGATGDRAPSLHEPVEPTEVVTIRRDHRCGMLAAAPEDQSSDGGACVIAPLSAGDRVIGQLHLRVERPDEIADHQLEVIAEVARALALALREAELREALREHQQQLEALVQHLPEGVVSLDREGRAHLLNRHGAACLAVLAGIGEGDEVTEIGGRPLQEFERAADESPRAQLVSVPPHRVFEVSVLTHDEGGAAGGRLLVLKEVTRELEHRRTLEQQDRVRVVGQLAAGIAHDFNNILQAILGLAELARVSPAASPTLTGHLEGILSEGRRGAKLIRQILDFTRSRPSDREVLDLGSLVARAVELFGQSLPGGIELTTSIEGEPQRVLGDAMQLHQMLTNLLANAHDATAEQGEIRVEVRPFVLGPDDPRPLEVMAPGRWAMLRVSDSGCGMTSEVLDRVFEPFFTTKPAGQGAGLGLSQAYGIAKQHEGFIQAESVLGEGSTVTIYLPAHLTGDEVQTAEEVGPIRPGRGELVLLVEDEAMVLETIRNMLETQGYSVIPAACGRRAVEIFAEEHQSIAVVISDVVLPDLDGVEVLKRVRRLSPATPAILMSGFPQGRDVRSVVSNGGVQWLPKPFDADQLARAVTRALVPGSGE